MRTRDSLLFALVAAVLGLGAGFLCAALLQGARPAQASATVAVMPSRAQPRVSPERVPDAGGVHEDVARVAAVVPAAAPQVHVPEAQLERALDGVRAPTVEAVLGGGAISGEIRDESGLPLAGAVVVGRQLDANRASDPDQIGGAPPEDASLEAHLRESAESWARARARTRRALSGADGSFELAGLVENASYSLNAYLDGYVLEAEGSAYSVSTGQRVVFRAQAVQSIPVQLVYEAGGQPSEGLVGVKRGNDERLYNWTSASPVLRLTPGRVGLRGYSGALRAQSGRGEVDSSHASQELSLEVTDQAASPIELVLTPRSGIRGRVIDEYGTTDGRQMVRLLALGSDGQVDLEALAGSDRYVRLSGDRFHLLDLSPGLYAIGLSNWSEALLAHEVVAVTQGVVEVELAVPEPDASRNLVVRAFGPSGRALRDLEFRWESRTATGSRSGGMQGRRASDGSYWLQPKADFFDVWGKQTSYTLTIEHSELGERKVELEEGQREVEVTYEEPVSLVVVVAGYAGSGYAGKLQVALTPVIADQPRIVAGGTLRRMRSGKEEPFSPEGVVRFDSLAPGRWKVDLLVKTGEWETRVVQSVEVLAAFGEQTVSLDLPALYDLVVVTPGMSEGSYLVLSNASSEDSEEDPFGSRSHAQVGVDGRAVFRGLSAGDYVLRGNGLSASVDVTVPCGDVYLDAKEPDCLRVAIGDLEGSLYKAGLRAGDLIIAVDGAEFGASPNPFELLIGEGKVELTVLRDGQTLALTLPRMAGGGDWWATLGGMLTPASRP